MSLFIEYPSDKNTDNISRERETTVYTCSNCPYSSNLMCCHNCPNF